MDTEYKATTMRLNDSSAGPVLCLRAKTLGEFARRARLHGLCLVSVWYRNQGQWWSIPRDTVEQELRCS